MYLLYDFNLRLRSCPSVPRSVNRLSMPKTNTLPQPFVIHLLTLKAALFAFVSVAEATQYEKTYRKRKKKETQPGFIVYDEEISCQNSIGTECYAHKKVGKVSHKASISKWWRRKVW